MLAACPDTQTHKKREKSLPLCQVASDPIAVNPTAVHVGMHIVAAKALCSSNAVNTKTAVKMTTCEATECRGCSHMHAHVQLNVST